MTAQDRDDGVIFENVVAHGNRPHGMNVRTGATAITIEGCVAYDNILAGLTPDDHADDEEDT